MRKTRFFQPPITGVAIATAQVSVGHAEARARCGATSNARGVRVLADAELAKAPAKFANTDDMPLFPKPLEPMKIELTDAYKTVSDAVHLRCALDDLVAQAVRVQSPTDLNCVPCKAGVYFIFSRSSDIAKWELRYIGQIGTAVKLRERLRQHLFRPRSSKTHSQRYCITEQSDQFGVAYREVVPVPARLLVEAICIALHNPPDNDKGRKREKL